MNIVEKLENIQAELKAPKSQRNTFGNYNYRSAEDILEAVKPLCRSQNCTLVLSDDLLNIGDRYYIEATATLIDCEGDEVHKLEAKALAREAETKKGMDASQITGTASSYARKYALNGLFCIDDTKDADTDEYVKRTRQKSDSKTDTAGGVDYLHKLADEKGLAHNYKGKAFEELTRQEIVEASEALEGMNHGKVNHAEA